MSTVRQQAVFALASASAVPVPSRPVDPVKGFGRDVFALPTMRDLLPKAVFRSVRRTMLEGAPLEPHVADVVAQAMKDWALGKGATHYAHIFYPLTGATAEKHDSFLNPDGIGGTIAEFSGKALAQGEPDASSFPNGGIRATFEARGYTAWDVTSPAYVLDGTLVIPTAFVSWTGEALDKKTPLLRSMKALNAQAQRILKLFGHTDTPFVTTFAGPEQEYFLVDRKFFFQRSDLLLAGRSLFGAPPAKGQEFEDQYFGAIQARVHSYMQEVEDVLFALGVPVKTRHNEVAPGQFEIAPVFETANIATDHQHLTMLVLRKVAERHGFVCLMHEKPFAGVNGSGKHVNFSFGNGAQGNLLDPGDTPHENAQFLVFCGAVIQAVSRHAGLLRAVIASASNDHRLGANEAPPAIISIFLGEQLQDVMDQILAGGAKSSKVKGTLDIGVDTLPKLPKDAGDRNRTSPFAFCGNRFEFRAVGSGQSIAGPLIALNTAVAESMDLVATKLEAAVASGKALGKAIQDVLAEILREHGTVLFNGNGYSAEWHAEAARRGLPNLKTTIDALPVFKAEKTIKLLDKYGVLTPRETESRYEIYLEQYVKTVAVEAKLVVSIAKQQLLPAATLYAGELAAAVNAASTAGVSLSKTAATAVAAGVAELEGAVAALEGLLAHGAHNLEEEAKEYCEKVLPAMLTVRAAADSLETLVAADKWPLPTYQEMLFIR